MRSYDVMRQLRLIRVQHIKAWEMSALGVGFQLWLIFL
jgi:hypothetical protein